MPFGALLVPELSIGMAVLAASLAAILAALLVAGLVALAVRSERSTLGILSAPFKDRGRWPLAGLLMARHVVAATFALVVIADSATLLGERSLGADLRPFWVVGFAAASLAAYFALRRWSPLKTVAAVAVVLLAIGIAGSAYMEFEIPSYLRRPAPGGWPEFWRAVNVMLVFPLLWLPVAADNVRAGVDARRASLGALLGLGLAATWFGALGIIYLPATDSGDIPGFLVGMEMGLAALVILSVLQLDEVVANEHSTSRLMEDLGAKPRPAVAALPLLIAVPTAIFLEMSDLEGYLLLVGSIFVPAFAVVIVYSVRPVDQPWVVPAVAWLAGFVFYQWIAPADIGWWRDVCSSIADQLSVAFPLYGAPGWTGAAMPSFVLAGIVQAIACLAFAKRSDTSLAPVTNQG
jgi:purine-cytosine permease-like protein